MASGILYEEDCPFCNGLMWEDENLTLLENCVFAHTECCDHKVLSRTEQNGVVTLVIKLNPLIGREGIG